MKKRILMLATGGTIASRESGQGLAPAITSEELLGYVPGIGELCRVCLLYTSPSPRDS